jgi:DNA repair exonuclease SbcCD ATPase subunit
VEQRDSELVDMQSKLRDTEAMLDGLLLSRDQQIGQIGQYEKELANVRTKLEAKESELEAAHLRLADAEKGRTSFDELLVSRNQQVEQYEEELKTTHGRREGFGQERSRGRQITRPDCYKFRG